MSSAAQSLVRKPGRQPTATLVSGTLARGPRETLRQMSHLHVLRAAARSPGQETRVGSLDSPMGQPTTGQGRRGREHGGHRLARPCWTSGRSAPPRGGRVAHGSDREARGSGGAPQGPTRPHSRDACSRSGDLAGVRWPGQGRAPAPTGGPSLGAGWLSRERPPGPHAAQLRNGDSLPFPQEGSPGLEERVWGGGGVGALFKLSCVP